MAIDFAELARPGARLRCIMRNLNIAGAACLLILAACRDAKPQETPEPRRPAEAPTAYEGVVRPFDPGFAIGGETDPGGFILEGASPAFPDAKRVYVRGGGIEAYVGKKVRLQGDVSMIAAGGVETPRREFPVIDVRTVAELKP